MPCWLWHSAYCGNFICCCFNFIVDCLVLLSLIWFFFGLVTVVTVKLSRCLQLHKNQNLFSCNIAQEESTIGRANMSNWTPLDISDVSLQRRKPSKAQHWLNTTKTTTSLCLKRIDLLFLTLISQTIAIEWSNKYNK